MQELGLKIKGLNLLLRRRIRVVEVLPLFFGVTPQVGVTQVAENPQKYAKVGRFLSALQDLMTQSQNGHPVNEPIGSHWVGGDWHLGALRDLVAGYLRPFGLTLRDLFPSAEANLDREIELRFVSNAIDIANSVIPETIGVFHPASESRCTCAGIERTGREKRFSDVAYLHTSVQMRDSGEGLSPVGVATRDYPEVLEQFIDYAKNYLRFEFFNRVVDRLSLSPEALKEKEGKLLANVEFSASTNLDSPDGLAGWLYHVYEADLTPRDVLGCSLSDLFDVVAKNQYFRYEAVELPDGFSGKYLDVFERVLDLRYDVQRDDPTLATGYREGLSRFGVIPDLVLKNLRKQCSVDLMLDLNLRTKNPLDFSSLLERAEEE